MLKNILLAGAVRTPLGAFGGALSSVPAPDLGQHVVRAACCRAGLAPDAVDEVILGNVLGAGLGQNVARQAALAADLPRNVAATTINKVCGSGLKAVSLAAQAIQCGDADAIVAGGTENMSAAPYLLPKARTGYRMGHGELVDAMVHDGLWDVYGNVHMGTFGDACASRCGFSREAQDDFAAESYRRALAAAEKGVLRAEIEPIEIRSKKETALVETDEGPARFNEPKMRGLRPAFSESGTVTAGNASSINDGAAAVAVLSADKAAALGIAPDAKVLGYAEHSREPEWFTLAPIGAISVLLGTLGWTVDDVDLFEINEAFAAVPMAAMKELRIPHEKVNIYGGAIALGHPIGASGARILVTLLNALYHTGGKTGIAALCIGGGEGIAMAVERG